MRFDTDLLALLPDWYKEILDYQELCLTEEERFEALAREINGVADNFFFQTMDQATAAQWEALFGIIPDPGAESLEFRRSRLINRVSSKPPYTLGFLYEKLDELIGPGKWTAHMDYPHYTLTIEASSQDQAYAGEVAFTIGRIKPAHVAYINSPFLHTGLQMGETVALGQAQYHYRLGFWALGAKPFAEETEKEVVKMAASPSIQEKFLAATARLAAESIAAARVNGSYVVEGLVKSYSGNTATVRYPLPEEAGPAAVKLELLDSAGEVLTSSAVYIPITGNVQIKHSIPITEAV
ncbi:putative phage tail protein [Acutalibacter intestini]|uniref:putative phage tail protein n=1 Tax=Acutalibacter intestini TaxID=3093659 RepID=UPI002AC8D8D2|nr:putative phage tail protein [Acutalibacter sp. M00204]